MSIAERLLAGVARLLLPPGDREVVIGDILELRAARLQRRGRIRANARALGDVLASASARWTGRPPRWRRRAGTRPSGTPIGDAARDVRLAVRAVLREPSFTLVAVATLAIGVGAVASVFGMANQLVLRPLPGVSRAGDAGYLRLLWREQPDPWNGRGLTTLDFDALRGEADFASALASYGNVTLQVTRGAERPIEVWGNTIYGDFFEALGARPSEGRLLPAEETSLAADPLVAVISERLRARLYGPGEEAAGSTLTVNGFPVHVVGVAADGFQGPERRSGADMWVPYGALAPLNSFPAERLLDRSSTMHDDLVVRLRPGWTPERVTARVQAILDGIAAAVPQDAEYLAGLLPTLYGGLAASPGARAPIRRALALLGLVASMVLLLACANAANLLLFRNVTRRGNAAVRRALGASSAHIVRGELVQSLVLATLGSAGGLAVARVISVALRGERLVGMPEMEPLRFDARVAAFAVGVAFLTALLFGGLPAALAGRFDLRGALQAAGRGDTGSVARVRSAMASAQVALSLTLLVTGVMLVRTVANLYALDTGMTLDRVAVLRLDVPPGLDDEARQLVRLDAMSAVEALPGVERASISQYDPLGSARMVGRIARGDDGEEIEAEMLPVSASWFDVMGVDLADGRPLRLPESEWGEGSVVLTAGLATRLFGSGEAALGGAVLHRFGPTPSEARVVAVTRDLRRPNDPTEPREAFLVPFQLAYTPSTTLVLRTVSLDPSILAAVRAAVEELLPDAPVADPSPLSSYLDSIHAEERVFGLLLALLSGSSLLLAAIGLYGVVAFAVAGRRRELGVRIAVGAGAWRIVRLVATYAGTMVGVGSVLGVAGGYALSGLVESRLYGVEPTDPSSYGLALATFVVTAALACWAPTRKAVALDPVAALRSE